MKRYLVPVAAIAALASLPASAASMKCTMSYTLSSWAAFYKTASGDGTVTCPNGQTMKVELHSEGGGFSFGKSTIDDGYGEFTGVHDIDDVLGNYVSGSAHAGAGQSNLAQGMTKGEISLSLTGKGRGVDLGVDFGKFTISRAAPPSQ